MSRIVNNIVMTNEKQKRSCLVHRQATHIGNVFVVQLLIIHVLHVFVIKCVLDFFCFLRIVVLWVLLCITYLSGEGLNTSCSSVLSKWQSSMSTSSQTGITTIILLYKHCESKVSTYVDCKRVIQMVNTRARGIVLATISELSKLLRIVSL